MPVSYCSGCNEPLAALQHSICTGLATFPTTRRRLVPQEMSARGMMRNEEDSGRCHLQRKLRPGIHHLENQPALSIQAT